MNVFHYAYAMGMNHINNWCWNDSDWIYFPWGYNFPSDYVPRDLLYWNRNCSLFFRQSEPKWRAPEVALLTCDNNRLSPGKFFAMHYGVLRGLEILYAAQPGEVCTLNEVELSIPDGVKLIYYPIPYLPSEDTLDKLSAFVKKGGALYISGDISYDELTRDRIHTKRLEDLCGVRFLSENYPNVAMATNTVAYVSKDGVKRMGRPGIQVEPLPKTNVLYQTEDGKAVVASFPLGKGKVVFCTDPLELHDDMSVPDNAAFYREIMAQAGVKPIDVAPYNPKVHAMRLPLADGGSFYTFVNLDDKDITLTLNEGPTPVTLAVQKQRPAALWFDGKGQLRGVEAQGQVAVNGAPLVEDGVGGIVFSANEKGVGE